MFPSRLAVVAGMVVLVAGLAWARRAAPAEVPPVTDGVLRYEVPHQLNPCHQRGGCVVASDAVTGQQKWVVQVYCTAYQPFLEQDVQDVFITSLTLTNGVLSVVDEKGRQFQVSTTTRAVTGDETGCIAHGCSSAPAGWWLGLPALVWLARRRVRASQRAV